MLTATKDLILPATVTGSWPRPRWFTAGLRGRPLDKAMKDVVFREKYPDALSALLDDQERAGLDILTHGDYSTTTTSAATHGARTPSSVGAGSRATSSRPSRRAAGVFDPQPGTLITRS